MKRMAADQRALVRRLHDEHLPVSVIAQRIGFSEESVRRIIDPEFAERRKRQIREARRIRSHGRTIAHEVHRAMPDIPSDEVERRLAEVPEDTRSLTGVVFGDPLPGRSALDMRGS